MNKEQFCGKLERKYGELKKLKAEFDAKTEGKDFSGLDDKAIKDCLKELSGLKNKAWEFYDLFTERAFENFKKLSERETPNQRSRFLASLISIASVLSEKEKLVSFMQGFEGKGYDRAFVNCFYASAVGDWGSFKNNLLIHVNLSIRFWIEDYPYNFLNKIRLLGIAVRNRELFNSEEKDKLDRFFIDPSIQLLDEDEELSPDSEVFEFLKQMLMERTPSWDLERFFEEQEKSGQKNKRNEILFLTVYRELMLSLIKKEELKDVNSMNKILLDCLVKALSLNVKVENFLKKEPYNKDYNVLFMERLSDLCGTVLSLKGDQKSKDFLRVCNEYWDNTHDNFQTVELLKILFGKKEKNSKDAVKIRDRYLRIAEIDKNDLTAPVKYIFSNEPGSITDFVNTDNINYMNVVNMLLFSKIMKSKLE